MIDYNLAKELEDAGFVQSLPTPQGQYLHDHTVSPSRHYYLPTLSELIEACGENFFTLVRTHYTGGIGWFARDTREGYNPVMGSTPEEAVARLWLALNKK